MERYTVDQKPEKLTLAEKLALDKLLVFVKADWPRTRFVLFGSKAKGTADEESDLDLLIPEFQSYEMEIDKRY